MILISHRGNINDRKPELENSIPYIEAATRLYDVEIDVWVIDDKFYLGHDAPIYPTDERFLCNEKFWCHAKNLDALVAMLNNGRIHCFWHQEDDVTLTSKNYLWTYPGKPIASIGAIAVVPERAKNWDISKAAGVCSDFIIKFT
jgi:hypothetical protein